MPSTRQPAGVELHVRLQVELVGIMIVADASRSADLRRVLRELDAVADALEQDSGRYRPSTSSPGIIPTWSTRVFLVPSKRPVPPPAAISTNQLPLTNFARPNACQDSPLLVDSHSSLNVISDSYSAAADGCSQRPFRGDLGNHARRHRLQRIVAQCRVRP